MNASCDKDHANHAYDKKIARWRSLVDWAKHRPWALKLIAPMSRGKGRLRFVDRLTDRSLQPQRPDFTNWESQQLAACWIGHATMLLRIGGMTILTDPVFSPRVGLGWGFGTFGPARLIAPACRIRDLPPIDLILISHAHFDHLDRPTLARLPKSCTLVCARGTRDLVEDLGFSNVAELGTGDSVDHFVSVRENAMLRQAGASGRGEDQTTNEGIKSLRVTEDDVRGVRLTALPQRHWGARIVLDNFRSYCAFLIEARNGQSILFGGDTAYHKLWEPIGDAGGVDLAVVGIGAYDPWIQGHANPEQAMRMAMHAGAHKVVAMHHSTFKLSREPMQEPLARFLIAAGRRVENVVCRSMGEIWSENR